MKKHDAKAFVDGKPIDECDPIRNEDFVKKIELGLFHIGQCYDAEAAKTMQCVKCGGIQFNVGSGSYYTAIRCPTCGWEICIHNG